MLEDMHSVHPIIAFRDPLEIWQTEPTFLVGEILFHVLLCCGLVTAVCQGRKWVNIFVGCFFAGGTIELFTILSPQIGNFYHSQAWIQLFGLREPFYMLFGCYIWILFVSLLLASRLDFPIWQEAAMAGLLCSFLWGLLDAVGLKFLWWTWHSSDILYSDRLIGGTPIASSFWILSTAICLSLTMRYIRDSPFFNKLPSLISLAIACFAGPFASMFLMNAPFTFIYHPLVTFAGIHSLVALESLRILCAFTICRLMMRSNFIWNWKPLKSFLFFQIALFIVTMALISFLGNPAAVSRTSFSQPLPPSPADCNQLETYFWGELERPKYLCAELLSPERDQFDFRCTLDLFANSSWYTVCGTPNPQGYFVHVLYSLAIPLLLSMFSLCVVTLRPKID